MLAFTVFAVASARLFAPAPPPAYSAETAYAAETAYSPYAAQMTPPIVVIPQATTQGSAADWVLPSVAMLGVGGIFAYLATAKDGAAKQAGMSRRDLLGSAAAVAAMAPLAASADGASSKAVKERSRAIYGSRVFRLQGKSAAEVLEEKNALTLFITGAYRNEAATQPEQKQLKKLAASIEKSAKAGDSAATQASLKEFISVAKLRELDTISGGNFNPTQRRNPGAPATSEIEAQMGTQAFALYAPLKKGAPPAINKGA